MGGGRAGGGAAGGIFMNELWKKRLPFLCAAAGGALLAGAVWACLTLERGGRADHITLAAALSGRSV